MIFQRLFSWLRKRYRRVRLIEIQFSYRIELHEGNLNVQVYRMNDDGKAVRIARLTPYTHYGFVDQSTDGRTLKVVSTEDYLILRFLKSITKVPHEVPLQIEKVLLKPSHIQYLEATKAITVRPDALQELRGVLSKTPSISSAPTQQTTTKKGVEKQPERPQRRRIASDSNLLHQFSTSRPAEKPRKERVQQNQRSSRKPVQLQPSTRITLDPKRLIQVEEETRIVQQLLTIEEQQNTNNPPAQNANEKDQKASEPVNGNKPVEELKQQPEPAISVDMFGEESSEHQVRETITIRGLANYQNFRDSLKSQGFDESKDNGTETTSFSDGTGTLLVQPLPHDCFQLEITAKADFLSTAIAEIPHKAIVERSIRYILDVDFEEDSHSEVKQQHEGDKPAAKPVPSSSIERKSYPALEFELPSDLASEWVEFALALNPTQREILSLILQNQPTTALDRIARQSNTTSNLLIDAINEQALETIEDNIVYTGGTAPEVEDEYVDTLQALLHHHSG